MRTLTRPGVTASRYPPARDSRENGASPVITPTPGPSSVGAHLPEMKCRSWHGILAAFRCCGRQTATLLSPRVRVTPEQSVSTTTRAIPSRKFPPTELWTSNCWVPWIPGSGRRALTICSTKRPTTPGCVAPVHQTNITPTHCQKETCRSPSGRISSHGTGRLSIPPVAFYSVFVDVACPFPAGYGPQRYRCHDAISGFADTGYTDARCIA